MTGKSLTDMLDDAIPADSPIPPAWAAQPRDDAGHFAGPPQRDMFDRPITVVVED